jgi:hypothetical protein
MNSAMHTIINRHQFETTYTRVSSQIDGLINIFERFGSNWVVDSIQGMDIRVGIFGPFRAACYIPTPLYIKNKKCTVNVRNNDDKCFQWVDLSILHPLSRRGSVSKTHSYAKFVSRYNFDCLKYPVSMSQIKRFEDLHDLAINIFTYSKKEGLLPMRISEHNYKKIFNSVNLLLLQNKFATHSHFVGIKDINRLLGRQNHHRKSVCFNCLNRF